jgi:hypothetical protein
LQRLYPAFETYNEHEEDRLEHLQIAKSRGKGAPKKKRTAAGEIGIFAQLATAAATVVAEGSVILTHLTQRARSSTARRGNSGVTKWLETSFCWEEFWDMVLERWNCTTISPQKYPSWERRLLLSACISYGSHRHIFDLAVSQYSWDLVLLIRIHLLRRLPENFRSGLLLVPRARMRG